MSGPTSTEAAIQAGIGTARGREPTVANARFCTKMPAAKLVTRTVVAFPPRTGRKATRSVATDMAMPPRTATAATTGHGRTAATSAA